ncbi:MAG: hypothetical protein RJA70_766 [Pseudomonadota bacterium]|jgi:signal transduction histidine kinase
MKSGSGHGSADSSTGGKFGRWLVYVPPWVTDAEVRRKAKVLAVTLVAMTALFLLTDVALLYTNHGYMPPYPGYALLVGTYLLNRRGHYTAAARLVLLMFPLVVFGQVALGTATSPLAPIGFLTLCPFLAALLLGHREAAALTLLNFGGVLVLPLLPEPVLPWSSAVSPLAGIGISGALAVSYMVHRDQMERYRRSELQASEERLRLALDAARMGSFDWNAKEHTSVVSQSMLDRFNIPSFDHKEHGPSYLDNVHPDDREAVSDALNKTLMGPGNDLVVSHRTPPSETGTRWLEVRGRLERDPEGHPLRMTGTVVDISEPRRLEEQLRQAQKMDAIGRLAGGIAHDLNNMLTVILATVDLLQDSPHRQELEDIEQAATSAGNLTHQLLAFSRQAVLHPVVLDLNDVVRTTTGLLRRIIEESVKIEVTLTEDLPNVRVDGTQLQEILMNLATNARDAMPNGGLLLITTQQVHSEGRTSTGGAGATYVVLTVTDTGHGFDEATRVRLFEPFFTTKPVGKGTGLGLAMVFGIVSQSGGHLHVTSSPGQGTTFQIFFPAVDGAAQSPARISSNPRGGPETILLVEDEQAVRTLCQRLLEREGYRVLVADNAAAAHVLWREHRDLIDLLLTDVVMPGGSGRTLVESLRTDDPELPVLYMSGYPQGMDGDALLSSANTAFLQKPFTRNPLLLSVRSLLDGTS